MASNSDTISHILNSVRRHPEIATFTDNHCNNVVEMLVNDSVLVNQVSDYFPNHKLAVNRMSVSFLEDHGELLDYFCEQTVENIKGFKELWITTAHLNQVNKLLIDLSFE